MYFFPSTLLITNDQSLANEQLVQLLALHGHNTYTNNFDLTVAGLEETIKIDEARSFQNLFTTKPLTHSHKTLVLFNAHKLSSSVQNCLLKLLEEPPEYASLVLVAPSLTTILPTILSRLVVFKTNELTPKPTQPPLLTKKLPPKEALACVDSLFPKTEKETAEQKRYRITSILSSELTRIHQEFVKNPTKEQSFRLELIQKGINMVKQNVDPKQAMDYLLLHF